MKTSIIDRRSAAIAILGLALASGASAEAVEQSKDHSQKIVVVKQNGKVLISANFKGAFTPETVEALSGGTPVTFTYVIQIKRERSLIWDETVRQVIIKRLVKYDALKKNYLVWEKRDDSKAAGDIEFSEELRKVEYKDINQNVEEGESEGDVPNPAPSKKEVSAPVDPLTFGARQEMEEWIGATDQTDLGAPESLGAAGSYYVRTRLKVKSLNPSPPLKYILFFVSFLDFDTGWIFSEPFEVMSMDKGGTPSAKPVSVGKKVGSQ